MDDFCVVVDEENDLLVKGRASEGTEKAPNVSK